MVLKTCSKCKKTKPISEFDPKRNQCKECRKKHCKEYQQNNKKKWNEYIKEYRKNNKEKIQEYQKEYRQNNQEKKKEYMEEYYQNNKEKIREYKKEYRKNNKEKLNEYQKEYDRNRRKKDPKYKLNSNISRSISASLHGNKNGRHWEDLVGYTLDELKKHLEKQFTDGMDWDNYGEWHIDHRIPLSAFNFTKPEHIGFQRAWALENLQPLWAEENLSKTNFQYYEKF